MEMLTGYGPPLLDTEGKVGQHYKDLNNGDIYKCVKVSVVTTIHFPTDADYIWELTIKGDQQADLAETDETKPGYVKNREIITQLSEEKANKTEIPAPYELPTASASVKGGVKVGKGLRMEGEALEKEDGVTYKLVKTVTLNSAVASFIVDGFSLKNAMFEFRVPAPEINFPVFVYINEFACINFVQTTNTKRIFKIFANTLSGKLMVTDAFYTAIDRFSQAASSSLYYEGLLNKELEAITNIQAYANTTNAVFPAGTIINVYEVIA